MFAIQIFEIDFCLCSRLFQMSCDGNLQIFSMDAELKPFPIAISVLEAVTVFWFSITMDTKLYLNK